MSFLRSYLPETINNNVMYYTGKCRCYLQYYINNKFSASGITDKLFVGDLASASNKEAMKSQGITHILSIFNGGIELYPSDFTYKLIHINDDPWVNIDDYFDESNKFIDDALVNNPDAKIMIHCQKGISRSVTLLLAYLVFKSNETKKIDKSEIDVTIQTLLNDVKTHRPIADPNAGFIDSLKRYVCKLNEYEEQTN